MGLGILEVRDQEHVPGTSNVYDDAIIPNGHLANNPMGLKYDNSGKEPIILVPQPSNDPKDPLNWPLLQRDIILGILCLVSVIASTLSPLLAANTLTLSLVFHRDFTQMALLTGYHLCGVAVGGILSVASARIWGKRHLYLLGTILIIASSAWGGHSGRDYKSLLWARVVQGIGLAPFEALVNASVGDLYFVHERGKRMAFSNMAIFGGAFFTPILVGKITHTLGWQWSFYFIAIFAGVMLPIIFLYVPETAFRRADNLNTDIHADTKRLASIDAEQGTNSDPYNAASRAELDGNPSEKHCESVEAYPAMSATRGPPNATLLQRLSPFNGRKTDENFFKLFLRPFPLFFHPAVLWGCLIQGCLIGWTVMIGVVLAAIFLGPPLFFNEVTVGYMYTGAFVGALLGFILAGLIADWSAKWMIKRNNGVFEPEFRIVLVIPQLILGCAGLYGFGITSANVAHYGWFLPDFFFALEVMGMVIGAVASGLYIVDAHREIAIEAFTCLLIFKNIFSFGLTWGAYDWLLEGGIRKIFIIIASIQVAVCLLSIPMYIFGKRNRALMQRYGILKMTKLQ
ncbi:hypothetical protein MMC25_000084 [Agyrium rufum]|nr:hypothetical protein [Agyrium rufum]